MIGMTLHVKRYINSLKSICIRGEQIGEHFTHILYINMIKDGSLATKHNSSLKASNQKYSRHPIWDICCGFYKNSLRHVNTGCFTA